ncbi:MAG: YybH family protein [Casimicrobiaceae bacterium]
MKATGNAVDLDRLFEQALNAGDIDALVALYEPQAALMPSPGKIVTGSAAIREALAGFIAAKPTIVTSGRLVTQAGDVALLTNRWTLDLTGPDGKPTTMQGTAVEVARRQPDGRWLFAMDMPFGVDGGGA